MGGIMGRGCASGTSRRVVVGLLGAPMHLSNPLSDSQPSFGNSSQKLVLAQYSLGPQGVPTQSSPAAHGSTA